MRIALIASPLPPTALSALDRDQWIGVKARRPLPPGSMAAGHAADLTTTSGDPLTIRSTPRRGAFAMNDSVLCKSARE